MKGVRYPQNTFIMEETETLEPWVDFLKRVTRLVEDKLKAATTELEHVKGVERKFILELDKNAEKDRLIQQLKEDAKVQASNLEKMQELEEQLQMKTQEHGGVLRWPGALYATVTEGRTVNMALESSKEALNKSEGHH